jgi:hypothetical protein
MKTSLLNGARRLLAAALLGIATSPTFAGGPLSLDGPATDYAAGQPTYFTQGAPQPVLAQDPNASLMGGAMGCTAGCTTGCDACQGCQACCPTCMGNWWDNTLIFGGGDAWKGAGEVLGTSNNFGLRTGFNTGFGWGDSKIRGQFGGSVAAYDFRGRAVGDPIEGETQLFLTTGIYRRSDILEGDRWSAGVVYDLMNDNNYGVLGDEITISQGRALVGYAVDERNEFGGWGAFQLRDTAVQLTGAARTPVNTVNQINAFWHHTYDFGGDTYAYVGLADGLSDFTWGLTGTAPLSNRLGVYGGFNYYAPSAAAGPAGAAEEFWNVSFGLVFYPGAKAANRSVSGWQGMPLLNVADNGTFQVSP